LSRLENKPRLLAPPRFDTVFLILGRACNLSCQYCLQHNVAHDKMPATVNQDVIDLLRGLAERQGRLRVQFYGGEPFVYAETMHDVVAQLADVRDKLVLTVITNGKALDDAEVDWCNANLNGVAVSWDGPASAVTRGYDVVAERREQLLRLNNLTFSAVISARTMPLDVMDGVDAFNADYAPRHNGALAGINLDELLCTTTEHAELADVDYDKLRTQVQMICDEYVRYMCNGEAMSQSRLSWITGKVNNVKHGVRCGVGDRARCGNGYTVLNVDGDGVLYACHNTAVKVGTVNDAWSDVLRRVVLADATPRHIAGPCGTCGVAIMCQNGCPLVSDEDRQRFYCRLVATIDEPVIDAVLEAGRRLGGDVGE